MQNHGNGNGNGNGNLVRRIAMRDETGKVVGVKSLTYYADLIASIQQKGVKELRTEIVQLPTKENGHLAVVKAMVSTGVGTFTGIGDASPISVSKEFVPHLLRVAETRAKARAIRDALGIGIVAAEELVDAERVETEEMEVEETEPAKKEAPQIVSPPKNGDKPMTEQQRRTLFRLLQSKGVEGEKAHEFFRTRFQVESLKEVSSTAAKTVIEELKNGNGHFPETEAGHA